MLDGRQRWIGLQCDLSVAKPLSIQHGLTSERHGTHRAAGITGSHATGNGEREVLGGVTHEQIGGGVAVARGQQSTLAANHAVSRSHQTRHETLTPECGGVRERGLISDCQLRSDLAVPVTSGPGQSVGVQLGFGIRVDKSRVDRATFERNFTGVSGDGQIPANGGNGSVTDDDDRRFRCGIRLQHHLGAGQGEDGRRIAAQGLLRDRRFIRRQTEGKPRQQKQNTGTDCACIHRE